MPCQRNMCMDNHSSLKKEQSMVKGTCCKKWLMEKLHEEESSDFIFQKDGTPSHWSLKLRHGISGHRSAWEMGRIFRRDRVFLRWPPRTPNLTAFEFFLYEVCEKPRVRTSLYQIRGWPEDVNNWSLEALCLVAFGKIWIIVWMCNPRRSHWIPVKKYRNVGILPFIK